MTRLTSRVVDRSALTPQVCGHGPLTCSTSRALDRVRPGIVWDANGYYRALGVGPMATRQQLREAYQALDGQRSPYLTYVLKQLLDPETRAKYDATPLGALYIDEYVIAQVRRQSAIEEGRRRAEQHARTGRVGPVEMIDWDDLIMQDDNLPPETNGRLPASPNQWGFSYYEWGAQGSAGTLWQWQRHLIEVLHARGVTMQVAVGVTAYVSQADATVVNGKTVAWISPAIDPDEALAEMCASCITGDK